MRLPWISLANVTIGPPLKGMDSEARVLHHSVLACVEICFSGRGLYRDSNSPSQRIQLSILLNPYRFAAVI